MTKPTPEQQLYIDSSINDHIYLEACPGSGKTEVIALKVVNEILQWDKFPSGMAILSFANSATDELRDRITKHSKHSSNYFPHFIGTFDSFILKNIVSPVAHEITGYAGDNGDFSLRVIESSSPVYIQTKYSIGKKGKQRANQYDYDLCTEKYFFNTGIPANDRALNKENLEGWVIKKLAETKDNFLEKGFATYRDVEHLAIKILESEKTKSYIELVAKKFPLIIIDECQDLSHEQLVILKKLSELDVKLHMIGDLNQAIYGFRNAEPEKVAGFIKNLDMAKLPLTRNFRSGQQIVDLCNLFVSSEKVEGQENLEEKNCIILEYNECPTEVIPTFLELTCNHQNRVVVARGYTTLNKLLSSDNKLNTVERLALAIVMFDKNNMIKIERSLTLFSEYLRNYFNDKETVKPHSFNCPTSIQQSLHWRIFLYASITHLVEKGLGDTNMDWKSWCKLVKTELHTLVDKCFVNENIRNVLEDLKKVNHPAPRGKGTKSIGVTLKVESEHKQAYFRSTTIHKVKGETHDATMLISSARSGKESHWKDWFKDTSREAARLAYVACSRPKYLLILAIKKPSNMSERKELESKGFFFMELV